MAQRKKKKGRRSPPRPHPYRHRVLLAALFVSGFLILCLVLLARLPEILFPAVPPTAADVSPPEEEGRAQTETMSPLTPPLPPASPGPRLVIIMDDLGQDLQAAEALVEIELPVTFAVLPGTPHASQVATIGYRRGREVMIHIPMEPLDFPATNPGSDALLVTQSEDEIQRRFRSFLARVPYAVGGNNHMGSRFTADREKMRIVLEEMKKEGLFFVDSLTSGGSVAFEEAQQAGLAAAKRDVFLDNVQDAELIFLQIRRLAALARREGTAVGICHPYPQTLEALRRAEAYLQQEGIEVVPVSRVLAR